MTTNNANTSTLVQLLNIIIALFKDIFTAANTSPAMAQLKEQANNAINTTTGKANSIQGTLTPLAQEGKEAASAINEWAKAFPISINVKINRK